MRKILSVIALCLLPAMLLSGCWSYRSLNDISIVMGIGIDKDPATGNYKVSSEIVDLTKSVKQSAPGAKLIESEGRTIFDALRNAKRKLLNKLYFGNAQIAAISESVAREDGIMDAVDWVMRDAEGRETINMLIAKGGDAKDLLVLNGADQAILSLELDAIISEDAKSTSSTAHTELYDVYDILNCQGVGLTLPAFHITVNDGQKVAESDGIAAFSGDKLVGFLSPEETKFFLIATGMCHGGILALARSGAGAPDVALEIADSKEKTTFESSGGQLSFRIETETDVYLAETMENIDVMDSQQIEQLQTEAGKRLELEINALIKKVQTELKTDIFGFGQIVHRRDWRLWNQLKDGWSQTFQTLPVTISCKVNIKNTAFIKSKEDIR